MDFSLIAYRNIKLPTWTKADRAAEISEAWWIISRFDTFRPKGREFESRASRHVGTVGKSFPRSCLWRFGLKLRHSIRASE